MLLCNVDEDRALNFDHNRTALLKDCNQTRNLILLAVDNVSRSICKKARTHNG